MTNKKPKTFNSRVSLRPVQIMEHWLPLVGKVAKLRAGTIDGLRVKTDGHNPMSIMLPLLREANRIPDARYAGKKLDNRTFVVWRER